MADKRELILAVKGKDDGASRVLKDVGDEASRSEDKLDGMRNGLEKLDKKISDTKTTIADLRKEIHRTGDVELFKDVNKQTARLRNLGKQKEFLLAGDDAAQGFAARFGARLGPLMASMPIGPHMAAAMAAAAPAAVSVLSAAIAGGVAVAGVGAGVALAAKSPEVKAAAAGLSATIGSQLEDAAAPFVPATLYAIQTVRQGFADLRPEFEGIFADAAPFLQTLTEGAVGGLKALVPALRDVVHNAEPVVDVIGDHLAKAGAAAGTSLRLMTQDSEYTARQLDELLSTVEGLIVGVGGLVAGINKLGEAKDGFLKKLGPVGGAIETALNPLGPAIGKLGELGRALGDDAEKAEAAAASTAAVSAAFAASNANLAAAKLAADAEANSLRILREEMDRIADTNISAAEASLNYRDAVNQAKNAADGHKKVSADEERQLLNLARSSNSLTGALEKQGASTGQLSAHTRTARANFIAAAEKMGYTKTQAEQLAAKYLTIPTVVSTTFTTPGLSEADRRAAGLQRRMRAMDGSVVDITFKYGFVGGDPRAFHNRMGGVYEHAAVGKLREAQIASPMGPARYAWAEPATGGEAFIPKRGDTARSMAILDKAASWYGASVTRGGQMQATQPSRVVLDDASTNRLARAMARELAAVWMGMYQRGSDPGRLANIYSRTG